MVYKTPGRPMARNLMEAGYELVLYNRTRSKAEELARGGAEVAENPKEVTRKSEVIFTMLPGPPEVEKTVTGEGGLLEEAGEGSLIVDTSTSSPVLAGELARITRELGVGLLDAPISGGDVGADEGTLSIMVGGSEEDFERARPLLEVMGRTVTHVGSSGAGQIVKACNQIVVALAIEAVSEALVLGSKGASIRRRSWRSSREGSRATRLWMFSETNCWNTTSNRAAKSSSTARTWGSPSKRAGSTGCCCRLRRLYARCSRL
jgi:2-hydroxy-3-oxopropionate reductase